MRVPSLPALLRGFRDLCILVLVDLWMRARFPDQVASITRRMKDKGVTNLRLSDPRYLNEKYLWRRLFDHDPRFTVVCDKIETRKLVADLGVDVRLPEIFWTGTDPDLIPEHLLGQDVIVKAAHGWNQSIYVRDAGLGPAEIREKCREFMASSHGQRQHQWGYFNAPRRILIEERLFSGRPMCDIKFTVFGHVLVQIIGIYPGPQGRTAGIWFLDSDGEWKLSDEASSVSKEIDGRPLPPSTDAAARIASQIGAAFDHMRVDFMTDGEQVYLGELTAYNAAGASPTFGHLVDTPNNVYWDLRRSWFLSTPQRGWRRIYAASLRRSIDRQARSDPRLDAAGPLDPAMLRAGLGQEART